MPKIPSAAAKKAGGKAAANQPSKAACKVRVKEPFLKTRKAPTAK
jgi:hypothetical protein